MTARRSRNAKKTSFLQAKLKLAHHRHTGHLIHHRHTSHGALMSITLATGLMLIFATHGLVASADSTQSGSLSLSGKVKLPPPSEPAVILSPKEGQVFTSLPIIISGSCQVNDFVQIYSNHKVLGSAACIRGEFGLKIDLFSGKNTLTVRTLDSTLQFGPDSAHVSVAYTPKTGSTASGLPQLLISLDLGEPTTSLHNDYPISINIEGGQAPYAISVQWGDGNQNVAPRAVAGNFSLSHSYSSSNVYSILVSATDNLGNKATTEAAVLVGGPALTVSNFGGSSKQTRSALDIVWPVYGISLAGLGLFWLGTKYELIKLSKFLIRK